jgi:outer membrane protein TolC
MTRILRLFAACILSASTATPAFAQISFSSAVGLAVRSNPKILTAQADVAKAQASLDELRDAYIPTITGGVNVGPPSYGFPLGTPSLFTITSQSLVFSFSQNNYVRAAKAALNAANMALDNTRQSVTEDVAVAYLALDHDTRRHAALQDEAGYAARLVDIVQARLNAGQDTPIDLTNARLSAAQIRLALLRAEDETEGDQVHLARLIGLPSRGLSVSGASIPPIKPPASDPAIFAEAPISSPAVDAAYATAHAKRQIAFGDARYLWRPQISFAGQYSRFAEFNNYQEYYLHFQQNNAAVGVQINLPMLDMVHRAKARESSADAAHSEHEADGIRDQFLEGRLKTQHATAELAARAEIAVLDQQLAQQQLDVILVQLQTGNGSSSTTQLSPKDEQTARIAEREKYLAVLDTAFQVQQAQISLLRQTGDLDSWLKSSITLKPSGPAEP